jgi:hypothetical protein
MADSFEISCINKPDRYSSHDEIEFVGGVSGGKRWRIPQPDAIQGIESKKWEFYVLQGGRRVNVIVASRLGNKYLKTEADGNGTNNLLSLISCPLT